MIRSGIILAISLLFTLALAQDSSAQRARVQRKPIYKLVFEENFDGDTLDSASWTKVKRQPYPWARYMSSHESLYEVADGRLRLYARVNDGIVLEDTARYITGGVSTQGMHTVKYGKVEVCARIHGINGTWPAIWLLRSEPDRIWPNPEYAEIDMVEYPNKDNIAMQAVHSYYTMELKQDSFPIRNTRAKVIGEQYNVYAVEILPDAVIFSINGRETLRYPRIKTNKIGQYPFGTDSYLIIDMQVGPLSWLKPINEEDFPAYMDIDWVKIYSLD